MELFLLFKAVCVIEGHVLPKLEHRQFSHLSVGLDLGTPAFAAGNEVTTPGEAHAVVVDVARSAFGGAPRRLVVGSRRVLVEGGLAAGARTVVASLE